MSCARVTHDMAPLMFGTWQEKHVAGVCIQPCSESGGKVGWHVYVAISKPGAQVAQLALVPAMRTAQHARPVAGTCTQQRSGPGAKGFWLALYPAVFRAWHKQLWAAPCHALPSQDNKGADWYPATYGARHGRARVSKRERLACNQLCSEPGATGISLSLANYIGSRHSPDIQGLLRSCEAAGCPVIIQGLL